MRLAYTILLAFVAVFTGDSAHGASAVLVAEQRQAVGAKVEFLQEEDSVLALSDVMDAYGAGKFRSSRERLLNFGIGSQPVWLRVEAENRGHRALTQRLSLETAWIDRVDVYFVRRGKTLERFHTGDTLPFAARPVEARRFVFEHAFAPGRTTVYVRAETPDPMVLPVYLSGVEHFHSRQTLEGYSYGVLYGGIFALLAYNLMLFFSLRSGRYLNYSLYLAAFLIMNAAYTGHGFQWLWPESPQWQQWSNPFLMMAFVVMGLLFATRFLNTRVFFPRLHYLVLAGCIGFAAVEVLAAVVGSQVFALLLAFSGVLLFSVGMVFMGAMSLYGGNKSAKYFLIASITHVTTAAVTAVTVWGMVPYTALGYRAVEIGMLVDAILLAMALADQFRISQEQKIRAERLAKVDPLTGLNNRRAFYDLVRPIWSTAVRKRHDMSVIVLDIDRFKSINDSYGHAYGDQVLTQVGSTLRQDARAGDILARWGGEEFIVFLPETRLEDAVDIAERFRARISHIHFGGEGGRGALTASLGVAHMISAVMSIDELVSVADQRLYRAKELGRDRVCAEDCEDPIYPEKAGLNRV